MIAEIITIGDEILIGQIIDTNSAWIAKELNKIGVKVGRINSISDNKEEIINALNETSGRASLVIITGGLGPTKDDITKKVLTDYFETRLVLHEPTLEHVKAFFARRGLEITDINRKQAEVPEKCEVLFNAFGTAPGMWFTKKNTIFVSIPGVPFEMKGLMKDQIIPKLTKAYQFPEIYHKTILTQGIGESYLAEKIKDWELNLPENIRLAYLPSPGTVRLRLSGFAEKNANIKTKIDLEVSRLLQLIPGYVFGFDEDKLEIIVGKLLKKNNLTVATAESCTGGSVASTLVSVPGCSSYFKGSIVAYSNEIKTKVLHVDQNLINTYGAVSNNVAEEMAIRAMDLFQTDYAIATSGIAGPDGGTEEKPVGTTCISVCSKKSIASKKFMFGNNRERNILLSTISALNMLRKLIQNETDK